MLVAFVTYGDGDGAKLNLSKATIFAIKRQPTATGIEKKGIICVD